jgi:hypothetical protein
MEGERMIGQGFVGSDNLQRTRSGIILPPKPAARAWVKIAGEPAQVLYEDPAEFMRRWIVFLKDPSREWVVFHDNQFGTPIFYFRNALEQIAFVNITHPTTEQARTVPGSIYAGKCPCAEFGGPCPPVEA